MSSAYFSNHSAQSRFLANAATPQQPATPLTNAPAPRNRQPSSKHFSTSVITPDDTTSGTNLAALAPSNGVHPLRNTYVRNSIQLARIDHLPKYSWVFWFRQQRSPGNKIISYEEGIKKISACSSVRTCLSIALNS